jgi:biopolymer transport protein ExbD
MRKTSLLAGAIFLAACNTEQYEPIYVAVYVSTKSCAIKEVPLDCQQLPQYLKETLKAKPDRVITVSLAGTEEVKKEDETVDRVAELIRSAGFTDVRAVRFGL